MALKIETKNQINRIHIDGDLTIYEVSEYQEALKQEFLPDKPLELDLGEVEEFDTSGLQLIAALCKQAGSNGADIRFTAMSGAVKEAVNHCRLLNALDCEPQEAAS